jgi:hypothetical protein
MRHDGNSGCGSAAVFPWLRRSNMTSVLSHVRPIDLGIYGRVSAKGNSRRYTVFTKYLEPRSMPLPFTRVNSV